jgi:hypothetical protein
MFDEIEFNNYQSNPLINLDGHHFRFVKNFPQEMPFSRLKDMFQAKTTILFILVKSSCLLPRSI